MFILKGGTESPAPSAPEVSQSTEKTGQAVVSNQPASSIDHPRRAFEGLQDALFDFGPLLAGIFAGVAIGAFFLSGQ